MTSKWIVDSKSGAPKEDLQLPAGFRLARSRIMYIEDKSRGLEGSARIGRVYFSKTGKTLYYRGERYQSLRGSGFKANYYQLGSAAEFWISGPRRDRQDRLYGGSRGVAVDPDVRDEYEAFLRGDRPKSGS